MTGLVEVRDQPKIMEFEGLPSFNKEEDKSRLRQLAGKFYEEFLHAKERKRARGFERRWIDNWRAVTGVYGPEWTFGEGESQAFYKRPRERVDAAVAKILRICQPLHGRPWGLKNSPIPKGRVAPDPNMRREAMRGMSLKIADHWQNADLDGQLEDNLPHMATFGTVVARRIMGYKEAPTRLDKLLKRTGDKEIRPQAKFYRCFDVYPDPDAKSPQKMGFIQVRHVLTDIQLLTMAKMPNSGFDIGQVRALIEAKPQGNWVAEEYETAMQDDRKVGRYVVYERWGTVPTKDQMIWGVEAESTGIMEAWHCEGFILKLKSNKFWEDELPFTFIRYRKQDNTIWGMGLPEMMSDVTWMQNALVRAMDEDLGWSSGAIGWVDMNQVTEKEIKLKPRKLFPVRSNEYSKNTEPIRFQLIPSKIQELMATFQNFDSMIPLVTGLPAVENPADAGSGMRTIGQTEMFYAVAEAFIKMVIGNMDRDYFTVFVRDFYEWEMVFGEDESIKGDFEPEALGVKGAIKREIIGQKAMELSQILANPMFGDVASGPRLLAMILDGMGMEGEDGTLTADELAQKMQAQAQQEAMNSGMKEQAIERVRAETSRKDALLALAKNTPDTNPAWGAAQEIAYESFNAMTPQLYAGIDVWAQKLGRDMQAEVDINSPEMQMLMKPNGPERPEDMDPDTRQAFNEVLEMARAEMASRKAIGAPLAQEIVDPGTVQGAKGLADPAVEPAPQAAPVAPEPMQLHIHPPSGKKTKKGTIKRQPDGSMSFDMTEDAGGE